MQRAPSQRWTSTKSKNIYDDWSDEEDSYDEDGFAEEDEDEYINQQQAPQKPPQQQSLEEKEQKKVAAAYKDESINQSGAQDVTKSTDRHPSSQIQDKDDSKSIQPKAEATMKRNNSIDSENKVSQDQKGVQQLSAPSSSTVPTMTSIEPVQAPIVESKDIPISKNKNDNTSSESTTDTVESYRKKSEREHLERAQNLNIMEGLYKSISNQLSINNNDDTREDDKKVYDSDDQGWDDTDEEDNGNKGVLSHQQYKNPVNEKTADSVEKAPVSETDEKSEYPNLEKGIDLDSSIPVSRPSLDIRPRPSSLVDGPEVKNSKYYSDTSRLDKNFEDLFEDFENLSFSTDPIKERTAENTPKKKENNALLTNLELDFQPLTPKRSPHIGSSVDDNSNNDSSNGKGGVNNKGLWDTTHADHSFDNDDSSLPELQKPPTFSKDSDNDSIVDSIADSDNFNLENGENKDGKSNSDDDYYDQNVSDSDDNDNGAFKASQGLWSQIPTDTTKKEVTKVADAGDRLPKESKIKKEDKNSLSDSIADSDDYNKPKESKNRFNEKVFGDNFPSKSFDLESVDTDSESVFRTSVYRNDFMNRTQQQQKHEVFDSTTLPTTALEAAEKYQNKTEPEKVNISTAKDILADESFSSNNTARPNTQGTADISFAKEYLGLADDDDEDDEDDKEEDTNGRGVGINDKSNDSDSDNDDAFKASGGLWSPNASVAPTVAAVGTATTTGIVATSSKTKYFEDTTPSSLTGQERQISDGSVQLRNFNSSDGHVPPPTIKKQSTISTFGETDTSSFSEMTSNIIKEEKAEDRKSFDPATFKETISIEKSNDEDNSDDENDADTRNGLAKISTNNTNDQTERGSTIPPGTPTASSKRDSTTTPIRQTRSRSASMTNDSPAVPPKDLNMFTPKQYQPVKHNLQQIMNNTPEQVHSILRAVRKDEYNHDSGLHTWLEATLKTASTGPKYGVTQIGPNTKAAYDAAAAKSSGGNTNPTLAARRMSFNSKINISSHRFLKGTKNVNKNVKGKLEEGFAKSLFKRKK